MIWLIYLLAGLGAGIVTGLAGLSAAVVITPLLVGVCGWEKQGESAIAPETAKAIRDSRAPEHEDSCSMCGKFCAVRSMNKALNGEYIDIL